MNVVARCIRIVLASIFGGIAAFGMLAFLLPMWISAGRIYLLPVTLALAPVMLVGAMLACLFGPLAQAIGVGLHYEDSLHGFPDDQGLEIRNGRGESELAIEWQGVKRIISVFRPPITEFRIYLNDGTNIDLATLATDGLQSRLEDLGIDWVGPEQSIFYAELEDEDGPTV